MSRSKDVENYPLWMFDILESFESNPEKPIRIECVDEKDAKDLRLWWTAFKRAGMRSERHVARYPKLAATTTRIKTIDGHSYVDISLVDEAENFKRWGAKVEEELKKNGPDIKRDYR